MRKAVFLLGALVACKATDNSSPAAPVVPTISLTVVASATNGDTVSVHVTVTNSSTCAFSSTGATLLEVAGCGDFRAILTQEGTVTITGSVFGAATFPLATDTKTIAVAHRVAPVITLASSNTAVNTTGRIYDLRFSVSDVDACSVAIDRTVSGDVLTSVDPCTHWTFTASQVGSINFTITGTKAGKTATAVKQIDVLLPSTAAILGSGLVATLNRALTVKFDVQNAKSCSVVGDSIPTYGVTNGVASKYTQYGCDSVVFAPGSTFPRSGRTVGLKLFASNGDSPADVIAVAQIGLVAPVFHVDTVLFDPSPVRSNGTYAVSFHCNDGCFPAPNGTGGPLEPNGQDYFGVLLKMDNESPSSFPTTFVSPYVVTVTLVVNNFPPGEHYYKLWLEDVAVKIFFTIVP